MVVLLTMTIDTNNCSYSNRNNIDERIDDYYKVIEYFLNDTNLDIVIVENSNHDIGKLNDIINNDRIEFLQFNGNNYNRHLGKGHGEKLIINYAIECSTKLKHCNYIFKLTGRYKIDYTLIKDFIHNDYVIYDVLHIKYDKFTFSGMFKIPKQDYINHISKRIIRNERHLMFENHLYNIVSNKNIIKLKDIGLIAINGTTNKDINHSYKK